MPKPALMYGVALLLVFAAGVAMGLYLGQRPSAASGKNAATASHNDGLIPDDAGDRDNQNAIFAKRIRELEEELAKQKSVHADVVADHLDFLKRHPHSYFMMSIDQHLKISQDEADFFKMTPSEKSAVEGHLAQIREKLKAELESQVIVKKQSATQVTFEIPVVPDTANLRSQMNDMLVADLGADRGEAFLQQSQGQLKNEFYDFGAGPMEIEISQGNSKTSAALYNYQITAKSGWGTGGATEGELPPAYQGVIPFEPTPKPAQ